MAYLEVEEMTTHIYEEDMDTISHGDDAAMMSAIDAAIEEVQGYLTKYDTGKIFAAQGKGTQSHIAAFCKGHSRLALLQYLQRRSGYRNARETLRPRH